MNEAELIFVYNAGSDIFSVVTDFAHKMVSPATYNCQLCALTNGHFSVKKEWKDFIQNLTLHATFLHKDEFEKQYRNTYSFPAIFLQSKGILNVFVAREEIMHCKSLLALQQLISQKLSDYDQQHHTHL